LIAPHVLGRVATLLVVVKLQMGTPAAAPGCPNHPHPLQWRAPKVLWRI